MSLQGDALDDDVAPRANQIDLQMRLSDLETKLAEEEMILPLLAAVEVPRAKARIIGIKDAIDKLKAAAGPLTDLDGPPN